MSTPPITEPIRIRVPGTTSNFGPGFDCLGAALQIHNEVELAPALGDAGPTHPMVEEVRTAFYAQPELEGETALDFSWSISGEVPVSRGLGSSVTLRLGILEGLNAMHGGLLNRRRLFEVCTELEGHPDNAGPAVFGGFFVGTPSGQCFSFPIDPKLRFVLLIRTLQVETKSARKVLPDQIARREAVANLGNTAGIAAAFASRKYEMLRGLFQDHLHQPYRESLNPGLTSILEAGQAAGAFGGFLSGSGSCIACLSFEEEAESIGAAMAKACPDEKEPEIRVVQADNRGSRRIE